MGVFYENLQKVQDKYGEVDTYFCPKENILLTLKDIGYSTADAVAKTEDIWEGAVLYVPTKDVLDSPELISLVNLAMEIMQHAIVQPNPPIRWRLALHAIMHLLKDFCINSA